MPEGSVRNFDEISDRLDQIIARNNISEIIKVAEALHEKKIARIADTVTDRREDLRLVLVTGPSAAGKTTFCKRLSAQLQVNGIRPLALSMDNYFVDREACPRDERGEVHDAGRVRHALGDASDFRRRGGRHGHEDRRFVEDRLGGVVVPRVLGVERGGQLRILGDFAGAGFGLAAFGVDAVLFGSLVGHDARLNYGAGAVEGRDEVRAERGQLAVRGVGGVHGGLKAGLDGLLRRGA